MRAFRTGDYNSLVSTCVGEEGLDIGDVDLIVCFDAHKSPIRLVQRMGRTGRKRRGRIVMLVTEGKEEQVRACVSGKVPGVLLGPFTSLEIYFSIKGLLNPLIQPLGPFWRFFPLL